MLFPQRTINCKGKLLSLDRPLLMAILNVTPDSFYIGSRTQSVDDAVERAGQFLLEGADILDIGGMSSRPGAELVPARVEADRVIPVIEAIHTSYPDAVISVDTVYAAVARAAVAAGAGMVNDISAGSLDEELWPTVAELQVPYILMHMKGRPETMKAEAVYEDLLTEIWDFMAERIGRLRLLGIKDIIIDPGFGFGKTIDHNFQLLRQLHAFKTFDLPLLTGISRKSMIWRTLDIPATEALNGSSALHMVALQQGTDILRVHDVRAAREVVTLWERIYRAGDDA